MSMLHNSLHTTASLCHNLTTTPISTIYHRKTEKNICQQPSTPQTRQPPRKRPEALNASPRLTSPRHQSDSGPQPPLLRLQRNRILKLDRAPPKTPSTTNPHTNPTIIALKSSSTNAFPMHTRGPAVNASMANGSCAAGGRWSWRSGSKAAALAPRVDGFEVRERGRNDEEDVGGDRDASDGEGGVGIRARRGW